MSKTINLLPEDRKNNLKFNKLDSFIIQKGIITFLGLMVFVLFMTAGLFIIGIKEQSIEDQLEYFKQDDLNRTVKGSTVVVEDSYQKTNKIIAEINERNIFWEYLKEINSILPSDLYYSDILIDSKILTLKGVALNRESLIAFGDLLKKSTFFSKVEMPISSITSQENIDYEINLTLNKK